MAEFSTTTITPADSVQIPAVNGNTPGNMTLQAVSNYNKTKLDIQNNLTSTDTDKPLSAYQGKILNDGKVNTSDIVDDVLTQDTEKPLSANMGYELQAEIDNLKARGRFLSLWNSATGLPSTNPTTLPYTYKAGDYYIISSVASTTNYKPSGSSYTGSASGTVESNTPSPNDFYEYDGTSWLLLINSGKTATFANLGGSPSDNQALASALAAKQNTLTFDSTPTSGSSNPVTSDGINSAISAISTKATLLWTNQNPTSSSGFPAQTLSIDLSGYNFILIKSQFAQSITLSHEDIIMVDSTSQITCYRANDAVLYRDVTTTSSSITFSTGYKVESSSIYDTFVIPLKIYGIK